MPEDFRRTAIDHYLPLANALAREKATHNLRLLGVSGAQGSGKSTLAHLLQQLMRLVWDWNVAIVSIDDFYLTRSERAQLAESVHPLLRTRGVPGTHDIELLADWLDRLVRLADGEIVLLPRFDKSEDDRAGPADWTKVIGPVDLVILEGWCVGSKPQPEHELAEPVNALESEHDPSGAWRQFVNEQLRNNYADLFNSIDYLLYLGVPDFDSVYRWRVEQEHKLKQSGAKGSAMMSDDQVGDFIQYYERLTRHNIDSMPQFADAVLELDRDHQVAASYYH